MPIKILILLASFVLLAFLSYQWISSLPKIKLDVSVEVSSQIGEEIFWGKGTCHVCHRIGERGYALRGPNLGESKDGPIIPQRATERAVNFDLKNGTEYLVQSIAEPSAFVVPGYNNEMPEVFREPIVLTPSEIKSVILYLQSLNGDTSFREIKLPEKLLASYRAPGKQVEISGDVSAGRNLFFDLEGPAACASCHVATDANGVANGSANGPDLTAIASFRTPEHILQKIINPDSNIVSGYEEVLLKTKNGLFFVGRVESENEDEIVLVATTGQRFSVKREAIQAIVPQKNSSMPSNYGEILTEKQIDDLLAYLVALTGANRKYD